MSPVHEVIFKRLRLTRKLYDIVVFGGHGHWTTPLEPSISGESIWLTPWKWIPDVSFPSRFDRLTTMVSPTFASITGHGHLPLIPIMGLAKPSGEALTQVTSQLYVTTSARDGRARASVIRGEQNLLYIFPKYRSAYATKEELTTRKRTNEEMKRRETAFLIVQELATHTYLAQDTAEFIKVTITRRKTERRGSKNRDGTTNAQPGMIPPLELTTPSALNQGTEVEYGDYGEVG